MKVRPEYYDLYHDPDICRNIRQATKEWYNDKYWPLKNGTEAERALEKKALKVRKQLDNIIHYHYKNHTGYYLEDKDALHPKAFCELLLHHWDNRVPLRKDKFIGFERKNLNILP